MKMASCRPRGLFAGSMHCLLASALYLQSPAIHAAPFSADGVTLEIPTGFEGPLTQTVQGANIYAFSKPSATAGFKTLLQITIASMAKQGDAVSADALPQAAERCVLDFLKGIERRRTDFSQSDVSHLKLAGLPASRITWKGLAQSTKSNGVMYCVIADGKAIVLHTQDTSGGITKNMKNVLAAFEDIKVAP
jgi:hypothetical protein